MDVDDSAICLLTTSLHNLRTNNVSVGTAASHLKCALLLLEHFSTAQIDTMGLLNKVMTSTYYNLHQEYLLCVQKESHDWGCMDYLDINKAEYRTLYCNGKWSKVISNQDPALTAEASRSDGGIWRKQTWGS